MIRRWDGSLVDCNQQYLDHLGVTREGAQSVSAWDIIHPDDHDRVQERLDALRAGEIDRMQIEYRLTGHVEGRWVRINAVRLDTDGPGQSYVLSSVEDITETQLQREALEYSARHDSLTGALNREALMQLLDGHVEAERTLPDLLIVDLDRFKLVNDSLGHLRGDRVLQTVKHRITALVDPAGGTVARLGGDEFAVVVDGLSPDAVIELAEQVRSSLEAPLEVDGRSARQTVSVGVAFGGDCVSANEMMAKGDRAMYAAKRKGRNCTVAFDVTMRDEALERVALERGLRRALELDEFEVFLQPEFSLRDRAILGAEALVRWRHPVEGLLPAGRFIEVAEEAGMIDEIGRFVLREACRAFARFEGAGERSLLRVNISALEFARPELPDLVRAALDESGLAPERLCLEMTETTLMDSPSVVVATLERLHEIGVEFAIDDFGTGYSSLAYLRELHVDALKIDRSFVNEIETNGGCLAIVESIVGLGRAMSLAVVAEGIENETQARLLADLGVVRGQGYLVSPALPASDFAQFADGRWAGAE